MDINLINFLEELETKGLFKSKAGEIDEKFKKFINSLKISIEEKQKWKLFLMRQLKIQKMNFSKLVFSMVKKKNKKIWLVYFTSL